MPHEGSNNRISIRIPQEELETNMRKLVEVYAWLQVYVVTLTPEERQHLPKMSEGNAPFVEKALRYARSRPELAPSFLKIEEMDIDFQAVSDLSALLQVASRICADLDDSIKLAGSEAWMAALAYYKSVKIGTQMNVPGARPVYEDLSKRFERRRPPRNNTEDKAE